MLLVKRSPSTYASFHPAKIFVCNGCKQGRKVKLPSYSHLDPGLTNFSVGVYHGFPEGSLERFTVHRRSLNQVEYVCK